MAGDPACPARGAGSFQDGSTASPSSSASLKKKCRSPTTTASQTQSFYTCTAIMADSKAAQLANNPQLAAAVQRNQGQLRRRAAQQTADKPNSTRAAGAGGSSNTMLRLYTDDNKGLSVDPVVVLVLAVSFVFSVVALHILAKFIRVFTK
ncbi:Arf guanine nucleotide exchange factor sbh1 [Tilletia horrida]|nr:Arf guanine nucleotide exchange factor sbh1 [Tilletia horrida]